MSTTPSQPLLNWGLIGAGKIAYVFANGMRFSRTGRIAAVASLTPGKADAFADDFGIAKRYTSYEELLADEEVQAVYISTIHPSHAEWAIKAAAAGKHILVEKPMAMNSAEASAMVEAARANDVFLMEAFMYRCHPQVRKLVELIGEGTIGPVRIVRAVFSFYSSFDPTSRSYAHEMGGGGILDVGGYPASFARLVAGAASGKPFLDPLSVQAAGKVGPTGVDHYTAATLGFENDVVAELITGIAVTVPGQVDVYGEKGILTVPDPWLPSTPCRFARTPLPPDTVFPPSKLLLRVHGQEPVEITVPVDRDLFTYEADTVAAYVGERQSPTMSWDDSLGNMQVLDRWREQVGVVYAQDGR